ncbi:MAG: Gfo/Idh/MocA family oxidoreductase [Spirochaetales bacterium]|nr:Gfo/Idh/MocA family oxidoreductase [Spirochaetales bacterium]
MAPPKMKISIAGFGRIVDFIHLALIKACGEFEVDGIYDITEKRRQIAANYGFKIYPSYEELLAGDSDLVLIATPPNSHYEMAKTALQRRKNVLVEKPVSIRYKEAKEIIDLAESMHRTIQVFYNRRFNPDYKFVCDTIRSDVLGPVLFVERRHHSKDAGTSFGVKSFDPEWRVKSQFGGGALFDWGIHLIDQLTCLNLGNISGISAFSHHLPRGFGETEDYVQANLELENRVLLSFEVNFRSHANVPLWLVGGEKQTLMINANYEALFFENGKVVRNVTLEKESRKNGLEIYQSFAGVIKNDDLPIIGTDEILRGMSVLETIKNSPQYVNN